MSLKVQGRAGRTASALSRHTLLPLGSQALKLEGDPRVAAASFGQCLLAAKGSHLLLSAANLPRSLVGSAMPHESYS